MESYSWRKLRLDQDTRITDHDDITLSSLPGSTDGLLALPPGIMAATPIDFWVTIPATWSDRAKSLTMTTAEKAGFASRPNDTIQMITEPEAAAVATLTTLVAPGITKQISVGDGGTSICYLV